MCLSDVWWTVLLCLFNATTPAEIYTLSLHDALPIFGGREWRVTAVQDQDALLDSVFTDADLQAFPYGLLLDRKSTRLNSSHVEISYAVFCLKKKKRKQTSRPARLQCRDCVLIAAQNC